jgi:hypothetical protein
MVNVYTTGHQGLPSIASDAAGNFVVVWHGYLGIPPMTPLGVFGRRFDANGAPLGAEFRPSTDTVFAKFAPQASSDPKGNTVVTWGSYGQDGSGGGVYAQRYDASGAPRGGEFRVNAITLGSQGGPSVASDSRGNFIVAWVGSGQQLNDVDVFMRRFDGSGAAIGADFRVNTYSTASQYRSAVAADGSGGFVVVWEGYGEGETELNARGIFAQRFGASGAPLGGEFRVNTQTTGRQYGPAVSTAPNGSFVVAWVGEQQDGSIWDVFAKRFDASGSPHGAELRVNTYTTGPQGLPAIASDSSGNFIVVWMSGAIGSGTGVFGQRFEASGVPRGGEFQVNGYTTGGDQGFPSIASDPAGNFVVAWKSLNFVDRDVFGRRFGGLVPVAVNVDPSPGNRVLEPGEAVPVRPSWRNINGAPQTFGGRVVSFTGPAASGVAYQVPDGTASYGTVASGSTAECTDCYEVTVAFTGTRPSLHWDAVLDERITPDAQGQAKPWTLHVGDSFDDVATDSPYYRFIETLLHHGVTGGCSAAQYCPIGSTTREQMAVFVLVSKEGTGYGPPACGAPVFDDVPASSPFCRWIEELVRRGVVVGCAPSLYCPTDPVSREQMAVFVLRTLDPALDPPACAPPNLFNDVPETSPFCRWIEELARRGVVTGCAPNLYCPADPVTREQMGVFLGVTFGLTLYGV